MLDEQSPVFKNAIKLDNMAMINHLSVALETNISILIRKINLNINLIHDIILMDTEFTGVENVTMRLKIFPTCKES